MTSGMMVLPLKPRTPIPTSRAQPIRQQYRLRRKSMFELLRVRGSTYPNGGIVPPYLSRMKGLRRTTSIGSIRLFKTRDPRFCPPVTRNEN